MRKILPLISLALSLSASVFAVPEYYSLSKSIRSLGMGGAFLSLSNDEYALFSNPAGLSTRRSGFELMARVNAHTSSDFVDSGFKLPSNLSDYFEKREDITANAGFLPYFVTKNLGIGLLLADTKGSLKPSDTLLDKLQQLYPNLVNGTLTKDQITTAINDIKAQLGNGASVADLTILSDSGLVVGYAQSVFDPNLHLGINLKGLFRAGGRKLFTAADYNSTTGSLDFDPKDVGGTGIGVDFDLGAIYEMSQLPFGSLSRASIVLSNLLATQYEIAKTNVGVPGLSRTLNLGWLTAFEGFSIIDNFNLMVDITDIPLGGETDPNLGARTGSFKKKLHVGLEVPMGRFALRTGLHQGYVTAGFGMNLWLARLDLATYAEETGENVDQPSRRYALTAAVGWASAPPAPIPATKAILEKPVAPKPEPKLPKAPQPEIQKPMVPKPEVAPPQQPVQPTKPSSPTQPKMETRPEATKTPSPAKEKL